MEHTRNESHINQAAGATQSAGVVLAAARKARRMSVQDVAQRLRLTPAQVQALEADDHAYFPGAVFARGFTKSYGRLVGVDVEPLLPARPAAGPAQTGAGEPATVTVPMHNARPWQALHTRRRSRLPAMAAASVLFLSALAYYEFVIHAPGGPVQVAVTASDAGATRGAGEPAFSGVGRAADTTPSLVEAARSSFYTENLRLKPSTDPSSGADARGLHFLFNNQSWVEVRDAKGKIVFSRLNAPGSESIVQGEPPFSIIIGGASGVQLSYNGNRVDIASHMSEDVARLRLE